MVRKIIFTLALILLQCVTIDTASAQADRFQPEVSPENVRLLEEARAFRRQGNTESAIKRLTSLVEAQPDYYLAHYNLGLAYVQQGEYENGIGSLQRALEIKERKGIVEATIYNSIGWAYLKKNDYGQAEKFLQIGLEDVNQELMSETSKRKLLNNIGLLYMYTGNVEQSRKYLSMAVKRYNSALARANLELLSRLEVKQAAPGKEEPESLRGYSFAVVGSFYKLNEARHFAQQLLDSKYQYPPEIYLAENSVYGVVLGAYLSYDEAKRRVKYAASEGIAKNAYVWQSKAWGENLFKSPESSKTGWAYLGHYIRKSKRWKTQYFEFEPTVDPLTLVRKSLTVRKRTGELNVREASPTASGELRRIIYVLGPGKAVQVMEVREWESSGFMWAHISYTLE